MLDNGSSPTLKVLSTPKEREGEERGGRKKGEGRRGEGGRGKEEGR
jgi:hypothetical protein